MKLLVSMLLLATCCSAQEAARPYHQQRYIMGTLCEITALPVPKSPAHANKKQQNKTDAAIDAAFHQLHQVDWLLSNWDVDSELMKMNRAAAMPGKNRPKVHVGDALFARVQKALHMAEVTDGWFDPTVGPLVRAYGFLPRERKQPWSLEQIREHVGWQKVNLDRANKTVQFAAPEMEIDMGGIAKGYAAAVAAKALRDHGVTDGFVNIGESSMVAIGSPAPGKSWIVEIYDPRDRTQTVAWTRLADGEALATSGTYEKTVGEGEKKKSHLIDPKTGEALGGLHSVTVVLRDAEAADAFTKPFFFIPARSEAASKMLQGFPDASVMLISVEGNELTADSVGAAPGQFHRLK
jgi:thiamine biosynthesis lipoprotein